MEREGRGGKARRLETVAPGDDVIEPKKIYNLGQPLFAGMPHFPTHPPFLFTLNKIHGEFVLDNGASSASETMTLGGHVGTHIDTLSHFSCDGKMHGGVAPMQSYSGGVEQHGVDTIAPILREGVLFASPG